MKSFLKVLFSFAMVATCFSWESCSDHSEKKASASLVGAGATFPLPYYNLAFSTYQKDSGVKVNYGGIGSGGGIRSLQDQLVDFGGSDAFLSDEELKQMPSTVLHIPSCLGAVVLAYNLPGVSKLNLTPLLLQDIYLGRITKWSDTALQAINPGVNLPNITIHPIYRSDGSGTTYVFSYYLAQINSDWAHSIGVGKSLSWPIGMAAKGNPGVAGMINQTEGALGYIGSEYAFASKIPVAYIQNASGKFILPTNNSISAAAQGDIPSDTRLMITNSEVENAYPISCLTWILIYQEQAYRDRSLSQAKALQNFLLWMIGNQAQNLATKVHYAPLSSSLHHRAQERIQSMTYNGKSL